jgi:hypothetical protein
MSRNEMGASLAVPRMSGYENNMAEKLGESPVSICVVHHGMKPSDSPGPPPHAPTAGRRSRDGDS